GHRAVCRQTGHPVGRLGLQGAGPDPAGPVRLRHAPGGAGGTLMTHPFPHLPELRGLLDALCEETITPEQMRRLEELVLSHVEAEAYYVQYMSTYADLARHFGTLPGAAGLPPQDLAGAGVPSAAAPPPPPPPRPRRRRGRGRRALTAALCLACAAAILLLAFALGHRRSVAPRPYFPKSEALDNTVAVLLRAPGAKWEETGMPTSAGA